MEQSKIDRLNVLAKKHREEGLTSEEAAERKVLREEYIAGFRSNLIHHLDNTYVMDEQGEKQKLKKRETQD